MDAPLKAYPYLRWSSSKQSDGSSDQRQREIVEDFCKEEGWPVVRWLTGDGVSAWQGDNLSTGDLGEFIAEIRETGGQGRVLVMEAQDRLSRLNQLDFFEWFIGLLKTGLTVAFAENGMIVDQHSIRNQRRQITRILEGQEESTSYVERLSRRVRAGYQRLRDEGGIVHSPATCPGWLQIVYGDTRNGKSPRIGFSLRHDRVLTLLRIFEEAASGIGLNKIAENLNRDKVPTWKQGRCWHPSTIKKLISDRAVLGEYQHKSRRRGTLLGDPDPAYFLKGGCPQPISDELFQRANDPRLRVVASQRSQGDKFRDLFSNLSQCHECGSRMTLIEREPRKGGKREKYLVCQGYKLEAKCDQRRRVRYGDVEAVVLDTLLTVALDDVFFQNDKELAEINTRLAAQRRALEDVGRKLDNIADALEDNSDDPRLLERYGKRKAEEEGLRAEVLLLEEEVRAAKGATSPEAHVRRVGQIRKDLEHFDPVRRLEARRIVKLAMNDLVHAIHFRPGKQQVKWPHQSHRRYPGGAPTSLHYVPTEPQDAIIVLKGGIRFIHVDLTRSAILFDKETGDEVAKTTDDPAILAYRRRMRMAEMMEIAA